MLYSRHGNSICSYGQWCTDVPNTTVRVKNNDIDIINERLMFPKNPLIFEHWRDNVIRFRDITMYESVLMESKLLVSMTEKTSWRKAHLKQHCRILQTQAPLFVTPLSKAQKERIGSPFVLVRKNVSLNLSFIFQWQARSLPSSYGWDLKQSNGRIVPFRRFQCVYQQL